MDGKPKDGGKRIDVEVLPPEGSDRDSAFAKLIATLMDDLVRVPGTQFRIGLDPILGLLPAFGDTGTAFVSMSVLVQAAALGVPKIAIARMALNILINTVLGAIPVAGDAFSVWFKSNARNHRILKEFAGGRRRSTRGDWAFVIVLLILLSAVVVLVVAGLVVGLGLIFGGAAELFGQAGG